MFFVVRARMAGDFERLGSICVFSLLSKVQEHICNV